MQGAQAVFRQAILRVKTRRSRARLLAASPVSRRCLALGKSAGCKCVGYRGRKLTAPHAKGCGGKATHRPPDVHLRPRAGTFRRNPSQTERTVTPKSDATRTAHSPSPDYISPSHPRLCHIIQKLWLLRGCATFTLSEPRLVFQAATFCALRCGPPCHNGKTRGKMTDYGFRGNAGSSSSAIKLRIYFWNPSLLLDTA